MGQRKQYTAGFKPKVALEAIKGQRTTVQATWILGTRVQSYFFKPPFCKYCDRLRNLVFNSAVSTSGTAQLDWVRNRHASNPSMAFVRPVLVQRSTTSCATALMKLSAISSAVLPT